MPDSEKPIPTPTSKQRLDNLRQDDDTDLVSAASITGHLVSFKIVLDAGAAAVINKTLTCFLGRVVAPLGGAMIGGYLANKMGADNWVAENSDLPIVAKPGKAPAHVGHKIIHKNAFLGALAGIAYGIAVGLLVAEVAAAAVAAAALMVATGGAAAVFLAIAGPAIIGTVAGLAGGFVGAAVGGGLSKTGSVTGEIITGSPNVTFEGKAVARVTDTVICSKDPNPPPQIVQGSKTITINGLPLARIGHKVNCSATIQEGCKTITADMTTKTYGGINSDMGFFEQSILSVSEILMMRSAVKEDGGLLGKILRKIVGEPVDMATGDYADYRTDFHWPHALPLELTRVYVGRDFTSGLLGKNWFCNWSQRLEYKQDSDAKSIATFYEADGQRLVYPIPHKKFAAYNLLAPHYVLKGNRERAVIFDERNQQSLIFTPANTDANIGRLSRIEDRNGNHIDFIYRTNGQLEKVQHSAGFCLLLECDEHGQLVSVVEQQNPEIKLAKYQIQEQQLLAVFTRFTGEFHYAYNQQGWLMAWRDSGATKVSIGYDQQGRVTATRTNSNLYADSFEYHDDEGRNVYINALGQRHEFWFDSKQRLLKTQDPLGRITQTTYDDNGWAKSYTDALGRVAECKNDERGRPIKISDVYGRKLQFKWDEFGQILSRQDDIGTVDWHYNAEGNVVALKALDQETRYRYDPQGNLIEQSAPDGIQQHWQYDAAGKVSSYTDQLGRSSNFSHDRYLRLISVCDAAGKTTRYSYTKNQNNPREALSQVRYADNTVASWQYDQEGLLSAAINPLGNCTKYSYGAFDLLAEVTDAKGLSTQYSYDGAARLKSITNANRQDWELERDAAGQLSAEIDWAGRRTEYQRNLLGQISSKLQADGTRLNYLYDEFDRLIEIHGEQQKHSFVWSKHDQLTDAVVWQKDQQGEWQIDNEVKLEYNAAQRLIKESQHGQSIEYQYDQHEQITGFTTPSGQSKWQFDLAGQLTQLNTNRHQFSFDYNQQGQESFRRYQPEQPIKLNPKAYWQRQSYDERDRLVEQSNGAQNWQDSDLPRQHTENAKREYQWDAASRLIKMTEKHQGVSQNVNQWRYDERDQITASLQQNLNHQQVELEKYSYNQLGHIERQSRNQELEQVHHYQGDLLRQLGTSRYYYDAKGRLIQKTEHKNGFREQHWHYVWDEFDRLRQVTTPEGEIWRYRYDAFGRRISKECVKHASKQRKLVEENYLWQGSKLIETQKRYCVKHQHPSIEIPDSDLAEIEIQRWHYLPATYQVVAQERICVKKDQQINPENSEFYPIACDPNGAPHSLFDSNGKILWRAKSELWGTTEQDQNREYLADNYLSNKANLPTCELRFAGQWADEESGLHYNLHRYYDPKSAQYLSSDPIGISGGLRTHAYVHDPIGWCDPMGLASCDLSDAPKYVDAVAKFKKMTPDQVRDFYLEMKSFGADYDELVGNAVDKHGLTPDEAHAVFGYTTKLFYRDLNQAITNGDGSATELTNLLNAGIDKMPPSGETQYRGYRLNTPDKLDQFDSTFASGKTVKTNFWSTAPKKEDAYAVDRNLKIETTKAKDITDLSFGVHYHHLIGKPTYTSEGVIQPGVEFEVSGTKTKDGRIKLEEK